VSEAPTTVKAALREQLIRPGGLALGFAAIGLALVAYFVLPSLKVPAQALVATLIVGAGYVWVSGAALHEALVRERGLGVKLTDALAGNRYAPKVQQAMPSPSDETSLMLLLEPNRLFGQSMLVSLYYEDERGFELLVGSGQVANVQTNGMIQITVTAWEEAYADVKRGILAQENGKIERLLVRPAPTTQSHIEPALSELALLASLKSWIESQNDEGHGRDT
jgi:hypothetical protein